MRRAILHVFPWGRWFLFFSLLSRGVQKRIPFFVQFSPIYLRGSNFLPYFSFVMMILPVIITFSFYVDFLLSSDVFSFPWDGSPDFWLWVDRWCHCGRNILSVIIRAEVVTHSARPFLSILWTRLDERSFLVPGEVASKRTNRL